MNDTHPEVVNENWISNNALTKNDRMIAWVKHYAVLLNIGVECQSCAISELSAIDMLHPFWKHHCRCWTRRGGGGYNVGQHPFICSYVWMMVVGKNNWLKTLCVLIVWLFRKYSIFSPMSKCFPIGGLILNQIWSFLTLTEKDSFIWIQVLHLCLWVNVKKLFHFLPMAKPSHNLYSWKIVSEISFVTTNCSNYIDQTLLLQ